jgi:hypothetical protein
MTTPSDGRAERRKPRLADAQVRPDRIHRHRHDLFETADPILGLVVKLPNSCSKCGDLLAPGKPPHCASLLCQLCGLHRGWISHTNYKFLNEITNKFGVPSEPIVFRTRNTKPEENDDGDSVVQNGIRKE